MLFELFAAAQIQGHTFYLNETSLSVSDQGKLFSWIGEINDDGMFRYSLHSVCGTARVTIYNRMRYNHKAKKWESEFRGYETLDLYKEENMPYAILRQELCHHKKQ